MTKENRPTRPTPSWLPLGAVAAGFGLAGQALAQAAPAEPAPETVMPVVRAKAAVEPTGKQAVQASTTRIGKGMQELRDVPQSVTVVTERLIDDRNLDTLKEALKNTAGISFQAAEGGEEDVRLRGFSLQATGDIFIDGQRDPAFYERDSFNWDRLEVLRGSASMLFGRGSTGGAVNQVSKVPRLLNESEVAITLGSGSSLRGTADLNQVLGENLALRVNAMATVADNHGASIDKRGIAPSLRWGIGTRDEFMLSLFRLENDNGIHYGLPWLGGRMLQLDPSATYGMASDVNLGTASSLTFSHTHRFADRSELKTSLRTSQYERDQRASAIRIAPASAQPGGVAVTQDNFGPWVVLRRSNGNGVQAKIQGLDTLSIQSDYDKKFQALGWRHQVLAGVDLAKDDFTGYAAVNPATGAILKPDTTVGSVDDGAWVDESLRQVRRSSAFESTATGVYAQDLVQVAEHWKLLGGLRWDRFDGRYRSYSTADATLGTLTAERARADSLWSRRFGVLWQPTPLSSFHLSYGTSFNTSGDAYQYDAPGSNTPPERSRNVELGAKLEAENGKASLRVALFHSTKTNERNRDTESVSPTTYLLSGQRHAAGLEVDIAGRITPAWEVYASYAWIPSAKIDKGAQTVAAALQGEIEGQRPGLTPRHSGTVWTSYQITPKWRIGGGLNARSSDKPQGSSIVAPSWITGDLMGEYVSGPLSFKLNLSNVTNKLYADYLYRGHYVAGKPRTVQFTTGYTF